VSLYLANMKSKFYSMYKTGIGVTNVLKSTTIRSSKLSVRSAGAGHDCSWIAFGDRGDTLLKMISGDGAQHR
jgi:hypothetical protein